MKRTRWIGIVITALLVAPLAVRLRAATITVCASGCNFSNSQLQSAINAATYGDTITLEAGITYTGEFTLPNKGAGSSYITIKSNASAATLPLAGYRTGPAYAAGLPKLKASGNQSGFVFAAGAHHYRLENLQFLHVPNGFGEMIQIGNATQKTLADLPADIIIDRVYFKGDEVDGQKRAVSWNGGRGEIINSYFEQITGVGQDTQCVGGWNTTGPLLIENNYCEAGTENILFGGSDPALRWRMTTTGNVSTTGANVQLAEPTGRIFSDLAVGDLLAIDVASGSTITPEFVTLTSIAGNGSTRTLTWSPALSANPDSTASSIRHDTVMKNLTVRYNHLTKDPAWRNPILGAPTPPGVALSAGGSLNGAKYYKVVAYATGYHQNTINSVTSAEVTATAGGANGTITISWTAVTGADSYRVYRGTSAGAENEYVTDTASPYVDDGSATFTAGSVPTSGHKWNVKNLFELKAAMDVSVIGNVMEHLWEDQGTGARQAWWIKSENQNDDGGCWTCTVRNAAFERNIIRKTFGWAGVQGRYAVNGSPVVYPAPGTNITLKNNLVYDCNGTTWGESPSSSTWVLLLQNGLVNFTLDHNTVICPGMKGTMAIDGNFTHTNFIITNNMMLRGDYGVFASGSSEGNPSLDTYAPTRTFNKNAIGGPQGGNFSSKYPTNTFYPTIANWEAAYTTYVADGTGSANFVIALANAYKNAGTDGNDVGADIPAVLQATGSAIGGTRAPSVVRSLRLLSGGFQ